MRGQACGFLGQKVARLVVSSQRTGRVLAEDRSCPRSGPVACGLAGVLPPEASRTGRVLKGGPVVSPLAGFFRVCVRPHLSAFGRARGPQFCLFESVAILWHVCDHSFLVAPIDGTFLAIDWSGILGFRVVPHERGTIDWTHCLDRSATKFRGASPVVRGAPLVSSSEPRGLV